MNPKNVIDLTMWLDPGEVWKRRPHIPFEPDPTPGAGMWGGLVPKTRGDARLTHNLRDWKDECRVERNIEAPPSNGLAPTLHIYCHSGTHIDSAFQDDPNGLGLWEIPAKEFCSYTVNLDLSHVGEKSPLTIEDLKNAEGFDKIERGDWLFLNSEHPPYRGPRVMGKVAQWICDIGIKGIGKSRSVGAGEQICHKIYHQNDLLIIDSLDQKSLSSVKGERLWTVAFPLAIKYLSTSPCRVVAFRE